MNEIVPWILSLYKTCKRGGNKIHSFVDDIEHIKPTWSFFSSNYEKPKNISDNEYYTLTQNIRNLRELTPEEIEYIKTLPKENLIELIEIYNKDICTVISMNGFNDN
jgi:hypothetical protein